MLGFAAMPFKVGLCNSLIYIGFHFEKLKQRACNSLKIKTKILHIETHSFAAQPTKLILLPYPVFGSGLFTRNSRSRPNPALALARWLHSPCASLPKPEIKIDAHCYTPAMRLNLKTFLLWLMIATLPLQGLAAAMKLSCDPVHHAVSMVSVMTQEHHHSDSSSDQHDHADMHLANGDTGQPDHPGANDHHYKTSTCSACAACCVGATAPPPAVLPVPVRISSELVVVAPAAFATGITPDGLERPPKRR